MKDESVPVQRKRMGLLQWFFLAFLIVGTVWILGRRQSSPGTFQVTSGKIFGTYYTVKYEHDQPLDSLILQELEKVDRSLSMFNAQSTISQINDNVTHRVDSSLAYVFALSQKISAETEGDFDVTVAPLVNTWGFGFKNADKISSAVIDSLRGFVGYQLVDLQGDSIVKKDPRVMMDFSAIAKGYGVDRVAELLNRHSIANYMVEIGGEVVVKGSNPKGKDWLIEITRPHEQGMEMAATDDSKILLEVKNIAMATSGNYRRFYLKDGKKYAHTINGHTGYPVLHSLLSATVLSHDCATADAYATSFMVMGLDKSKAFLERHPELLAYFIYADSVGNLDVWHSPQMEQYIKR